jgi:poly(3-hydroxybutyrate) depolymerase
MLQKRVAGVKARRSLAQRTLDAGKGQYAGVCWRAAGVVLANIQAAVSAGDHGEFSLAKTNAQWLSKSFRNADGQRDYRVYIPSTYHGQALSLVIMFHGANQDAEDFSAGTQIALPKRNST